MIYTREYRWRLGPLHLKHSYGTCTISVKANNLKTAISKSLDEFYKQYSSHTILSFSPFMETDDDQPRIVR